MCISWFYLKINNVLICVHVSVSCLDKYFTSRDIVAIDRGLSTYQLTEIWTIFRPLPLDARMTLFVSGHQLLTGHQLHSVFLYWTISVILWLHTQHGIFQDMLAFCPPRRTKFKGDLEIVRTHVCPCDTLVSGWYLEKLLLALHSTLIGAFY